MEVTINYGGQFVSVEVSIEVYEFLDRADHKEENLAHARIYDRILERCAPILFAGKNFREENAAATRTAAKEIVSPKERSYTDER